MGVEPVGAGARQAQLEAIRRLRGGPDPLAVAASEQRISYAGLVTRTVALAIDAAVIDGSAALVGVTVGLALSLVHIPGDVKTVLLALGGLLWLLWSVGYFVFFWSSTGQTLGARAMSIKVVLSRGEGQLKPRRALLRFAALCLGAVLLLAGILMMLWDDRRRCLQDRLARTVVVYVH
jgi:uncharacterized RDD family membrane protein YckC